MKDREAMRQHDAMIAKLEAALAELETPSL
jgi:hypothetical protein